MVELGIVGAKDSGKTTVIERLVRYLTEHGVRVATVKHTSHSHRFDTPGKDSHRHREAGAALTVVVSEAELALFARPDQLEPAQIMRLTDQKHDVWLVEGDRRASRPKVLVTRRLANLPEPHPEEVIATIGPEQMDNVPVHFGSDDLEGLCSFVAKYVLRNKRGARS